MARKMFTEVIGPAVGKLLGRSENEMIALVPASSKNASLDKRAITRTEKGDSNPQSRTRQAFLLIAAEVLGLRREPIAREMYLRDTYDRLSEEIVNGGTPIALEGFLHHLLDLIDPRKGIAEVKDAGAAWNHALATFFYADLLWDAMMHEALVCLSGQSKSETRPLCVTYFKLAYDRFLAFSNRAQDDGFGLKAGPAALLKARADSMQAVAAEQLFNLALLNEQKGWNLTIDSRPLSVLQAAELLPSAEKLEEFSATLARFLKGEGWIRRIENNNAVIALALASAAVEKDPDKAVRDQNLKKTCDEAVATLRLPCDGERVALDKLPTYQSLIKRGLVRPIKTPSAGGPTNGLIAVAVVLGLFFGATQPLLAPSNEPMTVTAPQSKAETQVLPAPLELAGPGGTRPVSWVGPGGAVPTSPVLRAESLDQDMNVSANRKRFLTDI